MFNSKRRKDSPSVSPGMPALPPSPPPAPVRAAVATAVNIIAADTRVGGPITTGRSLLVEGVIEGEVECDADLTVGEDGEIRGDIRAANVVVAGLVEGDIDVDGLLCVRASGRVLGNVRALRVSVEDGAVLRGRCSMGASASPQPASADAPFLHRMLDDDERIGLAALG
ncbi:MAG TPA: polymer-forming cytoskeletal protein [Nannocystaceae bacterium]|nr:polymer-forming cytoskeletal protein [Nannocystaceae bacterium]